MASTFTPNAHLELIGTGDQAGTWGSELNTNVFSILDNVLGNVQTLTLSSSDVTVTTTQSQVATIKLTGTLTANVNVSFPAIGRIYYIQNDTTGSFTIGLKVGTGTATLIPQGATQFYILDSTNVLPVSAYVLDSALRILQASDPTKVLDFDLSNLSTGTKRTLKAPDASGNLVLANTPAGGGRFTYTSSTVVALLPFNGNRIGFPSGEVAVVPAGGISSTINNAYLNGMPGQTLSANTRYYAYLWDSGSGFVVDWSTTGHSADTNSGIEIKTGDATRVLVGMAYPTSGPVFQNSDTARLVASWFNIGPRKLANSYSSTHSTASTSFVELDSEIRCQFVAWAGSLMAAYSGATFNTGSGQNISGPSVDGGTTQGNFPSTLNLNSNQSTQSSGGAISFSEGFHYLTLMAKVGSATGRWLYSSDPVSNSGQASLSGQLTT